MPIRIDNDLPAKAALEEENVFVMDKERACTQDIRPLKIAILNLMPNKLDTELHLLRSLSNTPLQLDITFLQTESYVPTHVSESHMEKFYNYFSEIKDKRFDGLIITGAPVELKNLKRLITGMKLLRSWNGPKHMSHQLCISAGQHKQDFIITMGSRNIS